MILKITLMSIEAVISDISLVLKITTNQTNKWARSVFLWSSV